MEILSISAIIVASAINSAMPGPCVALNLACSARSGLLAGLAVCFGTILAKIGLTIVALFVMLGALNIGETAFQTMSWIGASLLLFLSIRILTCRNFATAPTVRDHSHLFRDFSAGLCVGLCSPFNLVFLLVLLPQLTSGAVVGYGAAAVTIVAVALGAAVSSIVVSLIGAASVSSRAQWVRPLEYASAISMIGFAVVGVTSQI